MTLFKINTTNQSPILLAKLNEIIARDLILSPLMYDYVYIDEDREKYLPYVIAFNESRNNIVSWFREVEVAPQYTIADVATKIKSRPKTLDKNLFFRILSDFVVPAVNKGWLVSGGGERTFVWSRTRELARQNAPLAVPYIARQAVRAPQLDNREFEIMSGK